MAKKDFGDLGARLKTVADTLPGTRPPVLAVVPSASAPVPAVATPVPGRTDEAPVQQAFALRPALRKQLHGMAAAADMTVSGFILAALRDKGLLVTESDMADRRGGRRR